eukprot:SRR837773.533.p1 GENE.SRR837773.533~~SRR837773.533.p1  ORF type:complete len:797 (+),score=294.57 SRR837773.533:309-2393(+)
MGALREINRCFFQRLDDTQLQRFVRVLPMLRVSQRRWLFGDEGLNAEWPPAEGQRAFILLSGVVSMHIDPRGTGEAVVAKPGTIFGSGELWLGDEQLQEYLAGSAQAEEPCIVALITTEVFDAAFADRAIGNARIKQTVPRMAPVAAVAALSADAGDEAFEVSCTIRAAVGAISNYTTAVHVRQGQELLSTDGLCDSVVMVSTGVLSVRADICLIEQFHKRSPRRARLHLHIHKAEGLHGDSILDRLDPYVVIKLGEKKIQTPVYWNVGANAHFDYKGKFTYSDEETLQLTVNDRDQLSADDLCGMVDIKLAEVPNSGWQRKEVRLLRPKTGIFFGDDEEQLPAGKLTISVKWDLEAPPPPRRAPRERVYRDQTLFTLEELSVFGHEQVVLGVDFRDALERLCKDLPYALRITSPFRLVAEGKRGTSVNEVTTAWKASGERFRNFLHHTGRWKPFQKECSMNLIKRQCQVKDLVAALGKKWDEENEKDALWGRNSNRPSYRSPTEEVALDPMHFMVLYRGARAKISIKNAVNIPEGGWFDKVSPYAVVRFARSRSDVRTSVLQGAGGEPFWDCEGELLYNGEAELQVQIWNYDRVGGDELIGEARLQVSNFYQGFDGMVKLEAPRQRKSRFGRKPKPMALVLGVMWPRISGPQEAGHSPSYIEAEAFPEQPSFTSGKVSFGQQSGRTPLSWQGA